MMQCLLRKSAKVASPHVEVRSSPAQWTGGKSPEHLEAINDFKEQTRNACDDQNIIVPNRYEAAASATVDRVQKGTNKKQKRSQTARRF